MLVTQSCPTLCDSVDCGSPGSSAHGILQARILEWVANPFSRESSWRRDWTWVSCIGGRFFTIWVIREVHNWKSKDLKWVSLEDPWFWVARLPLTFQECLCTKSLQMHLTLCDPVDCSPPGSSVHGILQARILEQVAISSWRASSWPRDQTLVSYDPIPVGRFFTTSATWEEYLVAVYKLQKDSKRIELPLVMA